MIISSPVFEAQQPIPAKYTCQGDNLSPPLRFAQIPVGTKSLLLIVDDPDAPSGTFVHWIVWNIPPHVQELTEGAKELFQSPSKVLQGRNGFNKVAYGGPCPPPGKPHHYHFKLYALDTLLHLKEGASKKEVELVIEGHVLEQAELIGTFQR